MPIARYLVFDENNRILWDGTFDNPKPPATVKAQATAIFFNKDPNDLSIFGPIVENSAHALQRAAHNSNGNLSKRQGNPNADLIEELFADWRAAFEPEYSYLWEDLY
jgi:hypothetical protein